jgi:hypothetical protein
MVDHSNTTADSGGFMDNLKAGGWIHVNFRDTPPLKGNLAKT